MKPMRLSHSLAMRSTPALLALLALLGSASKAVAQDDGTITLIRLRTVLHGPVFNGEKPSGKVEFESENNRVKFSTEVDNVTLQDGTILVVKVDGHKVGTIKVRLQGGALLLTGQRAPHVTKGTRVGVLLGTQRILSGKF